MPPFKPKCATFIDLLKPRMRKEISWMISSIFLLGFAQSSLNSGLAELPSPFEDSFQPSSVLISDPQFPISDPEFDDLSKRLVFEEQGNIYLANLNSEGFLNVQTGREQLIDFGVVTKPSSVADSFPVGNGPEWGRDQNGASIFYMKEEEINGRDRTYIAQARENLSNQTWEIIRVPETQDGFIPIPTFDPSFRTIGILFGLPAPNRSPYPYKVAAQNLLSQSKSIVPFVIPISNSFPRWVDGKPLMSLAYIDSSGFSQAGIYDPNSREILISTTNRSQRIEFEEVWSFPSPELNGAYLLMTIVKDIDSRGKTIANRLEIFLVGRKKLVSINTIQSPQNIDVGEFILSPEPIIHEGKTFATFQTSRTSKQTSGVSEIWIAYLIPSSPPALRLLTDPEQNWARRDPEALVIGENLYVYYSVKSFNPDIPGSSIQSQLWRADTGL